ncbi:hypothetical protein, partial [Flavobacterium frigoris]|uniref:hypothetical protein n=1 Tax=Flavobacterium frigoris TaxID=229204 RepID=UPI0039E979B7
YFEIIDKVSKNTIPSYIVVNKPKALNDMGIMSGLAVRYYYGFNKNSCTYIEIMQTTSEKALCPLERVGERKKLSSSKSVFPAS